jgi:2-dehydro-3-deoxygluconokinase
MTYDVVCVGETMALVTPDPPGPLTAGAPMRLEVAGAESTVACYLAALGARTAWISRVGADPLGRAVRDHVAGFGVDVSMVDTDPEAPTGVFFKHVEDRTTVWYYRRGSAASRLGPGALRAESRVLHLSGITPALSASCAELVHRGLSQVDSIRSFDVNHRPGLWSAADAAPVLAGLADRADVVFVGLDEAERLWDTATPDDVRKLLPGPGTLVVKDGATGATAYTDGRATFVPAGRVDVVEPVGAGDAFAAGYLYGLLRGWPDERRLRLGHRVAAAALRVTGDVGPLPPSIMEGLDADA